MSPTPSTQQPSSSTPHSHTSPAPPDRSGIEPFPAVATDKAALDAEEADLQLPASLRELGDGGEEGDLKEQLQAAVATARHMQALAVHYRIKLYTGHRHSISQANRNRQLEDSVASLTQSLDRLREVHAQEVAELEAKLENGDAEDQQERERYVADLEREIEQWRKLGDSGASHMIQPVKKSDVAADSNRSDTTATTAANAPATSTNNEAEGTTSHRSTREGAEGQAAELAAQQQQLRQENAKLLTQLEHLNEEKSQLQEQLESIKDQLRRSDQARVAATEASSALELQSLEQNSNIDRLYEDTVVQQQRIASLEREVNELSNHEVELHGQVVSLERKEAGLREQLEVATKKSQEEQLVKARLQKELAEKGDALRRAAIKTTEAAATPSTGPSTITSPSAPALTPPTPAASNTTPSMTAGTRLINALAERRKLYATSLGHKRVVLVVFVLIVTSFYFFTTLAVFGGGQLAGGHQGTDAELAPRWAMDAIKLCEARLKGMQIRPHTTQEQH